MMQEPVLLELRPICDTDRAFLLALYASARAYELSLTEWSDEQKRAFIQMQFDAQTQHYQQHYQGASFDLIMYQQQAVGRLYVARSASAMRIVDIALMPEYCGRGWGTQLLKALQQQAEAQGKTLEIHVEQFNPALRLYERLGFVAQHLNGIYYFMTWSGRSHHA